MNSIRFTVPFARVQQRSRKGAGGRWYAPSSKDQKDIGLYALRERQSARVYEPFKGDVHFMLTCYGLKGDVDNALKLCMDALNGVIYEDDAQVVFASTRKIQDVDNPRMDIEVMTIE